MPRIFLLLGLILLQACPQDPVQKQADAWLLKVRGAPIAEAQLVLMWAQREVFNIPQGPSRIKVARKLARQLGEEMAFAALARESGLHVSVEELNRSVRKKASEFKRIQFMKILNQEKWTMASFRNQLERRLLVKKYFQMMRDRLPPISEDAMRQHYQEHYVSKSSLEEVRALHLLLDTEEEAEYVRSQLSGRNAMPFEVAARRFSKSPESERGGVLEWFSKGTMPKVFEVCFELKPGEISKVLASEYGFHVFKLLEKREGTVLSFQEKKEAIGKALRQAREEGLIEAQKSRLFSENVISVNEANLEKRLLELSAQMIEQHPVAREADEEELHEH